MRLIDADALIHELNNSHYPGAPYVDAGISIAIGKVCDAPTIEPERKTGEWEMVSQHDNPPTYIYSCSECRHKSFGFYNFCPNCGAEMIQDEDDIPMEYFESGGM